MAQVQIVTATMKYGQKWVRQQDEKAIRGIKMGGGEYLKRSLCTDKISINAGILKLCIIYKYMYVSGQVNNYLRSFRKFSHLKASSNKAQ